MQVHIKPCCLGKLTEHGSATVIPSSRHKAAHMELCTVKEAFMHLLGYLLSHGLSLTAGLHRGVRKATTVVLHM